jgi:beta-lactam-binding protein with PASTA domain
VIGLKLAAAKSRIRRAYCSVGRVTRRKATRRSQLNRVLKQRPKPGTRLASGGKVSLVVGRR